MLKLERESTDELQFRGNSTFEYSPKREEPEEELHFFIGIAGTGSTEYSTTPIDIPSAFVTAKRTEEMERMKGRIKDLENRVNALQDFFGDLPLKIRIIDVRDVPIKKAKELIYQYYEAHPNEAIYPDDIADELGLDLKTTVEAVDLLLKENKIEEAK